MLIYEAYNTKNGKSYIGLTTTTLEKRKSQHIRSAKTGSKMHFHKAIRKLKLCMEYLKQLGIE